MIKTLLSWLRIVAILYLIVCGLAWLLQRKLMYMPATGDVPLPSDDVLRGIEDVRIETADGETLRAWYRPGTRPVTVILFHGNAGHRGHRAPVARALARRGWGVLIPDYRGYGGSSGSPSEEGLYADAEACRAYVQGRGAGALVYMGSSLGSGVAVELARRHPPAALVLQSPFDSMVRAARGAYPILPVGLLLRDRYESDTKIGALRVPLFVAHGDADRIIPQARGRRLFELAAEPKHWHGVAGAGHNDLWDVGGEAYWDAIDSFLREHVPEAEGG